QLRRAENLRALRAVRNGNNAADVREHVLLQAMQLDGVVQDLPAYRRRPLDTVGNESSRDAAGGRCAAAGIHAAGAGGDSGACDARGKVARNREVRLANSSRRSSDRRLFYWTR